MLEVVRGGTASVDDVALVIAALAGMPAALQQRAVSEGVRVAACRTSVVDMAPELRNVIPDGWPTTPAPGRPVRYWQDVPGAFLTGRDLVAIATIGHGAGETVHVPLTGEGHGSADLALHEFFHSFDHHLRTASATSQFDQAWQADHDVIALEYNQNYFLNATWGRRETFAESGARRFAHHTSLPRWPATTAYWNAFSGDASQSLDDRMPDIAVESESSPGIAVLRGNGDVDIFWNAVSEGAEGHYYERLPRDTEANESFGQRLFDSALPDRSLWIEHYARVGRDLAVQIKPFAR